MSLILPISGSWLACLDRHLVGLNQGWASNLPAEATPIILPGDVASQGLGDPITPETPWIGQIVDRSYFDSPAYAPYREPGNVKMPFWLQPELRYQGVVWYERTVVIPESWRGLRVTLVLERAHWETRVWLDGQPCGAPDLSLSTPHRHELGRDLAPGAHRLVLRVDNSLIVDIGYNSHSISDHTQGNWNGVVGRIDLEASPATRIEDIQAYPNIHDNSLRVTGALSGPDPHRSPVVLAVALGVALGGADGASSPLAPVTVTASPAADGSFSATLALGPRAARWDEFSPVLHRLTATLPDGHARTTTFGLREIGCDGSMITVNGRRTLIRSTLECAIFPRTGYPPTEVAEWRRILGVARAHGLNSLRFHSWCPPEAAFVAGDELGFYFQIEAASWANDSTRLGDGLPVEAWIHFETDRILRAYGNHPCFAFMAYGNEPGSHGVDGELRRNRFLSDWVLRQQARDSRRLYCCGAGWPELPEDDFHIPMEPRIQGWGQGLNSRINALPPETCADYRDVIAKRSHPVISHEIGQWCAYPNFDEIPKYTGNLRARNFEIFRASLQANHLGDQARAFLHASGKLQALCYKEDIESVYRTPGMAGFQLLDLHDFPGQGTALVGVLDAFWEPKGYITAAEYNRFCANTVPLARLPRRVFSSADTLTAAIEVAHYGPHDLPSAPVRWSVRDATGSAVRSGSLPARTLATGGATAYGELACSLADLPAPARYRLELEVAGTGRTNDWDFWVYPDYQDIAPPPSLHVAERLDEAALAVLARGGDVLLHLPPERVPDDPAAPITLGFSSIFWNTAWSRRQAPTTLGILCDPAHPALAAFPTDAHTNWHWWYLVTRARPMILDGLPPALRPVVQVIDDWFTNHRLALVFEARVGAGRLLVSSLGLPGGDDPVCRQMLVSLHAYAASPRFAPAVTLETADLRRLGA